MSGLPFGEEVERCFDFVVTGLALHFFFFFWCVGWLRRGLAGEEGFFFFSFSGRGFGWRIC